MKSFYAKTTTFFVLFALMLLALGVFYFYPPNFQAEVWNISEGDFGNISFSIALFAFPTVYWVANVQKLKWLGFLFTFFDITIVLYLIMWMRSAVYWSPLVICWFNYILLNWLICGRKAFLIKYEDLFSRYIVSTYLVGGALSFLLWGIFCLFD